MSTNPIPPDLSKQHLKFLHEDGTVNMSPLMAAQILARFNKWRRGEIEHLHYSPQVIGMALDVAVVSIRCIYF